MLYSRKLEKNQLDRLQVKYQMSIYIIYNSYRYPRDIQIYRYTDIHVRHKRIMFYPYIPSNK